MRFIAKTAVCMTAALALSGLQTTTDGQHGTADAADAVNVADAVSVTTFSSTTEEPSYTFIAAPDFLNQDVGDVSRLPTWRRGDPNSWTPQLQTSIDVFLDEVQGQHPGSVLVAGDLVEGHWLQDIEHTGIFGRMRTSGQKVATIRRAGNFYHSRFLERFTDRGLTLHAAVGDHDIGDNPWNGPGAQQRFKRRHVGVYKDVFAKYYTRTRGGAHRYGSRPTGTPWADTAYAVQLSADLLLVSLDVFHVTRNNVVPEVVGGQLAWLRHVLKKARARRTKWIVVQGHTPVAMPVRKRASSGLSLRRGTRSPLWRTMARYGVDLYLAGEVHNTTMRRAAGVTQITTGGLVYRGEGTYLAAKVHDDRIDLDAREFDRKRVAFGKLWQFGAWRTNGGTLMFPGSHSVGTLTLRADHTTDNASGKLVQYRR